MYKLSSLLYVYNFVCKQNYKLFVQVHVTPLCLPHTDMKNVFHINNGEKSWKNT